MKSMSVFISFQDTLVVSLEKCVKMLEQAERYEIMPEVYKLIVPIYEEQRNYEVCSLFYVLIFLKQGTLKYVKFLRLRNVSCNLIYTLSFSGPFTVLQNST